MKRLRKLTAFNTYLLLLLLILATVASNAWAVHEGIGCSTCHNLFRGDTDNPNVSTGNPGEACLTCHDANKDSSGLNPPYVMNGMIELAGGSFTATLSSDQVGHNVLSLDMMHGNVPPGGFAMDQKGCLNCHDHHNNGNYRNLKTKINGISTVVEAVADPLYQDNLYISGINEFCGACHERFHGENNTRGERGWVRHPVGVTIYGAEHADFEGWSTREPELTLVENPTGNPNDLYSARVFCLSCHFAHGSSYNNAMRWENYRSNRGCLECHSLDNS